MPTNQTCQFWSHICKFHTPTNQTCQFWSHICKFHMPTNQTCQFWSYICKFIAQNRAAMQETRTRRNLCKKPHQTHKFLMKADLYSILAQVSWLCVTSVTVGGKHHPVWKNPAQTKISSYDI